MGQEKEWLSKGANQGNCLQERKNVVPLPLYPLGITMHMRDVAESSV